MIYALSDLLKQEDGEAVVNQLLAEFRCEKNPDVENFLKSKAIRFEVTHNARTYLITNELMQVLAYFSLSFKEVVLDNEKISKTVVKNLDGFDKHASRIRVFLIGQIGKNDSILPNPIDLAQIFIEIFAILKSVQKSIGGRAIVLECQPIDKLLDLYQRHGFKILPVVDDSDMVTLYHAL